MVEKSQINVNIFANTLRFKTKSFPVPINVQFIEKLPGMKMVVSDSCSIKTVQLSSKYDYLFELSILAPLDIVTIYEIKRVTTGSCDLFVDNIGKDKKLQVGAKIGNPIAI